MEHLSRMHQARTGYLMRSLAIMNSEWDVGCLGIGVLRCNSSGRRCPGIGQQHSRVISFILVMHNMLDHIKRNLHMNRRTFVFKLLLNRCLSSHRCKVQQLLISELLNSSLENMTSFCRVPYISSMVPIRGMRVILTIVGELCRLDLFRNNCLSINQYR